MLVDTFSDEDLALMTPAEREAVTADDDDSDMNVLPNAQDDEDEPAAETKEAPKAEVTEVAPPTDDDSEDSKPLYVAPSVEDYDNKLAAAEARKDDAFKKMMEGELSDAEYRTIEKEVSAEIRRLDRDMAKAEISAEMNQQHAKNAWGDFVTGQIEAEKKAGIDLTANEAVMKELDRTVKLLAKQVQEDASMVKHLPPTKPGALITNVDKWILSESLAIVKARNKLVGTPVKPSSREPDMSGLPPSLARVPVAAEANTGGDEFAAIRNLSGVEYERAIAKMSPEALDRFLG